MAFLYDKSILRAIIGVIDQDRSSWVYGSAPLGSRDRKERRDDRWRSCKDDECKWDLLLDDYFPSEIDQKGRSLETYRQTFFNRFHGAKNRAMPDAVHAAMQRISLTDKARILDHELSRMPSYHDEVCLWKMMAKSGLLRENRERRREGRGTETSPPNGITCINEDDYVTLEAWKDLSDDAKKDLVVIVDAKTPSKGHCYTRDQLLKVFESNHLFDFQNDDENHEDPYFKLPVPPAFIDARGVAKLAQGRRVFQLQKTGHKKLGTILQGQHQYDTFTLKKLT